MILCKAEKRVDSFVSRLRLTKIEDLEFGLRLVNLNSSQAFLGAHKCFKVFEFYFMFYTKFLTSNEELF